MDITRLALGIAICLCCSNLSCGGDGGGGGSDGDTDSDGDSDTDTDTDSDGDSDTDADTDTDTDSDPSCEPLPPSEGNETVVTPDQAGELQGLVASAQTGDVILLEDGTYDLNGAYLWFGAPGVTMRSAGGDPEAVIIDGNYSTTEIVTVAASDVTIAEVTLRRAYTHPIHVTSSDLGDTLNTLIYRVRIVDPREQAIKINPHSDTAGYYPDQGEIACSTIELTDEGRLNVNPTATGCYTGGVDAHQARGWVIRDNHIEGFWCPDGLAEHAIHMWRGCRDTIVERNELVNNARGVGFGLMTDGEARQYDDDPCPEAGSSYVGHYGGTVRNNFVFADDADLFASDDGYDCGICLWSACGARVVHNTLAATQEHTSSVEWRFAGSQEIEIYNNLATDQLWEREDASATLDGNLELASTDLLEDVGSGDLHLAATAASAIDQGVSLEEGLCDFDIDGEARDDSPDVGADELLAK